MSELIAWGEPAGRTKNSRDHLVPLCKSAKDTLTGILCREGRDLSFSEGEDGFSLRGYTRQLKQAWN